MKLIEVHYENIMILEDQLTVDNSQAHSEVNIDDKAVNDQTLKSDSVNKTDPQMRSKADSRAHQRVHTYRVCRYI